MILNDARLKVYAAELEDPKDPYGAGAGFFVEIVAHNKREAKLKMEQAWPTHPYNTNGWYNSWKVMTIYRTNRNPSVIF